ncbi:Ni,Fe-hydrogenase I cytochrome b subunit [hydrothermal vent metagenome]|uniref:Ni,Fe-hydrogenase I cytochrome b subunit n=1 Tax=hydrothermal vent metagenome TaxID=652676 RepID=A0A1W1BP04_9ZZZZ
MCKNKQSNIKVWDIVVRIFHWSLVISFFTAYISEEGSLLHIYSGYTVLFLITFRVLWGIVGSKYARFSNFIYSPTTTLNYLKEFINKKPKRYLGHNPAGTLMIIILLLSLFLATISGLKIYAIEEGKSPFSENNISIITNAYADYDDDDDDYKYKNKKYKDSEEFWEEVHEASVNFILFLIFLHILGVIISGKLHNENLIKSMITGNKKNNENLN